MKSKATSFGIAALMVLMAFCCVSVTDEVDANTTLTGMHFDAGDTEKSRLFTVNEGEYYGYAYTISIGVDTFNGNTNPSNHKTLYAKNVQANDTIDKTTDITTTIDESTVDITEDGSNKGSYNIIITRDNTLNQFDYILDIKIDMKVTVGTIVVTMNSIHLRMSVSTSESTEIHPNLNNMEFEVGKYGKIRVSESGTPVLGSIDLYHWYAEDLPEGLSMSENGYVSGIAEATQNKTAKVYIFGHEGNGEYAAELRINIKAATNNPESFDYTITGGIGGSTNCYDYVAVEGATLTLTLTAEQQSTFSVTYIHEDSYKSIDIQTDNEYKGECTIIAEGTGCYKVNIVCKYDNDKQETKFFHIYVIPAFDVVQAQVMISSS